MLASSQFSRQSVLLERRRKKTDLGRRALQLLPETSLHLPSSGCRLKWSNIPYPRLARLCFPKEMRHLQSRCSSALPSPSHNNPRERRNTAMEAGKGTEAPAVTHPLGWAESGRSPRAGAVFGCPARASLPGRMGQRSCGW